MVMNIYGRILFHGFGTCSCVLSKDKREEKAIDESFQRTSC